jgi:hypothetical protein
MKILIQNLDDWPVVAEPAVWRELLECTHLTLQRAERSFDSFGNNEPQSLYPKCNLPVVGNPGGRMNTQKSIADPESVRLARIGELKIDGKPALNLVSDMRSASRQVFSHLAAKYPDLLAVVAGKGLSVKGSGGEYRRISGAEFEALLLETFVLCYEQPAVGENPPRLELVDKPSNRFWVGTILQGRWLDEEMQSLFCQPPIPRGVLISRP